MATSCRSESSAWSSLNEWVTEIAVTERPYLSIGEVLGLLLEEFADVTISKIRFLESQGLIEPERTPSGYRKFYDADVERLRVILREQRENFLPLRVIRDRLEQGSIDPDSSGAITAPRGIRNVTMVPNSTGGYDADMTGEIEAPHPGSVVTAHHPAARANSTGAVPVTAAPTASATAAAVHVAAAGPAMAPAAAAGPVTADVPAAITPAAADGPAPTPAPSLAAVPRPASTAAQAVPADVHESFTVTELCAATGISAEQLAELESFGLLTARRSGGTARYSHLDAQIVQAAAGFLGRGVEARHLRAWRQAVDREAALFDQLVLPLMRQRNPTARQQAAQTLQDLSSLGGDLRTALLNSALKHHFES
jgi:DNA-binding transcriptional MerR regulator